MLLLSVLVTLQQALSSGYLNSVITTIEKRYEIPSSISGIVASMYEVQNNTVLSRAIVMAPPFG